MSRCKLKKEIKITQVKHSNIPKHINRLQTLKNMPKKDLLIKYAKIIEEVKS